MASNTEMATAEYKMDAATAERLIREGKVDEALNEWLMRDLDAILARLDVEIPAALASMQDFRKSLWLPEER